MTAYVLDTSALLAFKNAEPGADIVEDVLRRAKAKKTQALISFISQMEFFYITWQKHGKERAYQAFLQLKMLPVSVIEQNEALLLTAGEFKATCELSLADALIAATARHNKAVLIHKDPEYEALTSCIDMKALPYKN